jgi:hypothetical protein
VGCYVGCNAFGTIENEASKDGVDVDRSHKWLLQCTPASHQALLHSAEAKRLLGKDHLAINMRVRNVGDHGCFDVLYAECCLICDLQPSGSVLPIAMTIQALSLVHVELVLYIVHAGRFGKTNGIIIESKLRAGRRRKLLQQEAGLARNCICRLERNFHDVCKDIC